MNFSNQNSIQVIAPNIYQDTVWNESEVLGYTMWLWN